MYVIRIMPVLGCLDFDTKPVWFIQHEPTVASFYCVCNLPYSYLESREQNRYEAIGYAGKYRPRM